jgi:hypothetical protein
MWYFSRKEKKRKLEKKKHAIFFFRDTIEEVEEMRNIK